MHNIICIFNHKKTKKFIEFYFFIIKMIIKSALRSCGFACMSRDTQTFIFSLKLVPCIFFCNFCELIKKVECIAPMTQKLIVISWYFLRWVKQFNRVWTLNLKQITNTYSLKLQCKHFAKLVDDSYCKLVCIWHMIKYATGHDQDQSFF